MCTLKNSKANASAPAIQIRIQNITGERPLCALSQSHTLTLSIIVTILIFVIVFHSFFFTVFPTMYVTLPSDCFACFEFVCILFHYTLTFSILFLRFTHVNLKINSFSLLTSIPLNEYTVVLFYCLQIFGSFIVFFLFTCLLLLSQAMLS